MQGKCLCGAVRFEVYEPLPNFYQCHCSQCRKLSGSASDTALFLDAKQFNWVGGQEQIRSYSTASGYRSDFCGTCGSTLPHKMQNGVQFWVPAGLLEGETSCRVTAHLCVDSKASWDLINDSAVQYGNMPDMTELNAHLKKCVLKK